MTDKKDNALVQVGQQEILPASLQELLQEASRDTMQNLMADNTRKAYRSDWDHFCAWCDSQGVSPMPASPAIVIAYLEAHKNELKRSTLERRVVSIGHAHRMSNVNPPPTEDAHVRYYWKGLRRSLPKKQKKAKALPVEILHKMLSVPERSLAHLRDQVMLAVGFLAGLRRGEVVRIRVEDLEWEDEGVVLTIPRSKADQEGEGREIPLPYSDHDVFCIPSRLKDFMKRTGIEEGWLFRGWKGGKWGARHVSTKTLVDALKQALLDVGEDPMKYSAHSLRAGVATLLAVEDVNEREIQEHLGHKNADITRGYIRIANRWRKSPLKKIIGKEKE